MMPGMNGLEVCRQLRTDARTKRVPIIMLTAKAAETDKIVGLEMGADDYIVKPFSVRELLARVRAVLRRTRAADEATDDNLIKRGYLTIDVARHEVKWGPLKINLTATEFRILEFLVRRPNRVFSRQDIIENVLDPETNILDRTIDVHMTSLRKKLGPGGLHIETIRGFGYKWADERPDER
jgi:two-component system phosphate regulon response regulator PhoB